MRVSLDGLTRTARTFVGSHAVRIDVRPVGQHRKQWLGLGIPSTQIDRVVAYQARWGGLVLPPGPCYDGGPKYLAPDVPVRSSTDSPPDDWWFEAGPQRTAVPYSFMIGPAGEFGIHAEHWSPLHETVEGWVESQALARLAALRAERITRVTGADVEDVSLDGFEPVPEVRGLADTWWRGPDSLVAVHRGEAECLSFPRGRTALIYSGLDKWSLGG